MKRAVTLIVFLLLALPCWPQRSSYDLAPNHSGKQRDGFVDFALKQINPRNTDYGCQMDEARKFVVDETIKSIESWTVVVTVNFLVLSFFMLLHQRREANRRELITAQYLAQYHNNWTEARRQAEEAIRRYNELVNTTNSMAEAALRAQSHGPERIEMGTTECSLSRDLMPQSTRLVMAPSSIKEADSGGCRSDSAVSIKAPAGRQNREVDVDLIAQISTLQQQLSASQEREKNLQKELSKAQRRPPTQQPRGANLAS